MKCKEFCDCYGVTPEVLEELMAAGLIGKEMFKGSLCEISDSNVQNLNHILTLKNAGMSLESIGTYLEMEEAGTATASERLRLLNEERSRQLTNLHEWQKTLDRIDYLIVDLKRKQQKGAS